MQDVLARSFVVFVLALYAGISLVFVMAGIREWIWRAIAKKVSHRRSESNYRGVKSPRGDESPS